MVVPAQSSSTAWILPRYRRSYVKLMLVPPGVGSPDSAPGGGAAAHAGLGQDLAYGTEDAAHLVFAQPPDAADAEAVRDGQLAGIDDEAPARATVVEALEVELGVGRHSHRDDDRRLERVGQERLEPERAETVDEDPAVVGVARAPPGDAALGRVLGQGLVERGQHVGRRGEAPLPGLLHRHPLVMEIEGERGGVSLRSLE